MLFPLISVSLIGLLLGVAGLMRQAPAVALFRCLLAAWLGFTVGAILGLVVEALVIGGFWIALIGHIGAMVAASRTSQVSTPPARRSISS